jgi:hypothetical protein
MINKVLYTILLLILLELQSNTGSAKDEAEINIAAIVPEMMEQARNLEPIVGISKDQLKVVDPYRMLALLAPYEKDTEWAVRRLALRYGVQLADAHPVPEIRQEVTRRLVEASITGSMGQAGTWLMNFTAKDFSDQSKSLIRQALTRANKGKVGGDMSVWLCGVANMQDQLTILKELMIDELSYRNYPNMKHFPKWYYTTGWVARLARARMGVKEDIERCIELVEEEENLDRRVTILLPRIAYIRQPQAIECLREYFLSNERLSPTNPGALGMPISKYLMSELADCLINFPVKKREARNYKDTEINLCRKWMKEQEEWKIIR